MKKVFVVIALAVLVASSALADGTGIDVWSMSVHDLNELTDEELFALHDLISAQCSVRDIDCCESSALNNSIPIGEYICGKHIAAGRYVISNPNEEQGRIWVYQSQEAMTNRESSVHDYIEANDQRFVELEEGMILVTDQCTMLIERVEFDWML